MNDLTAAIGLAQLKKVNYFNKKRNLILKRYLKGIQKLHNIKPVFPHDIKNGSYWLFSVKTKFRDNLINFLKKKNISTAVHFVPLPFNKLYKKYNKNSYRNTKKIWKEIVSLPFFPDLENNKIDYVIKCLKIFDKKKIYKNEKFKTCR